MEQAHLSQEAYNRLQEELTERSTTGRRDISMWIERAREHGDIKENADYDAAKNEQGLNEARVRQLEAMLRDVEIVEVGSVGAKAAFRVTIWSGWMAHLPSNPMAVRTQNESTGSVSNSTSISRAL